MPLFFFVGGFSNLVSFDSVRRRGGDWLDFLHRRFLRVVGPTAVMVGMWLAVGLVLELNLGRRLNVSGLTQLEKSFPLIGDTLGRPLWFVGIYMIVIAFAPAMLALHRRYGIKVPAAMAAAAVCVDIAAVGLEIPVVGYLNFAFVWLFVHQLGFFYAEGRFNAIPRSRWVALSAAGLTALVVLTTAGPYALSMVGVINERSNANPPTIAIIALTLWQLGLAMLIRPLATRWLENKRPWIAVIFLNSVILTLFLWHQTALFLGVLILYPLGFPQPAGGSAHWWALRPPWLVTLTILLAGLVLVFRRFERPPASPALEADGAAKSRPRNARSLAIAGVAGVVIGVLGFAVGGFGEPITSGGSKLVIANITPIQSLIALAAGGLLLSRAAKKPA